MPKWGNLSAALESQPDVYYIESVNIAPVFKGEDPLPETMTVGILLSTIIFK